MALYQQAHHTWKCQAGEGASKVCIFMTVNAICISKTSPFWALFLTVVQIYGHINVNTQARAEILWKWLVVDIYIGQFFTVSVLCFSRKSYRQVLIPDWGRCRAGLGDGAAAALLSCPLLGTRGCC